MCPMGWNPRSIECIKVYIEPEEHKCMNRFIKKITSSITDRYRPHDGIFERLLDLEFADDLRVIMILDRIPTYERTDPQASIIDHLKGKYAPEGSSPSALFPHVSKRLQTEYLAIRSAICAFLYG